MIQARVVLPIPPLLTSTPKPVRRPRSRGQNDTCRPSKDVRELVRVDLQAPKTVTSRCRQACQPRSKKLLIPCKMPGARIGSRSAQGHVMAGGGCHCFRGCARGGSMIERMRPPGNGRGWHKTSGFPSAGGRQRATLLSRRIQTQKSSRTAPLGTYSRAGCSTCHEPPAPEPLPPWCPSCPSAPRPSSRRATARQPSRHNHAQLWQKGFCSCWLAPGHILPALAEMLPDILHDWAPTGAGGASQSAGKRRGCEGRAKGEPWRVGASSREAQ